MCVPIKTETISSVNPFTAILRASKARSSLDNPSVSIRKIGMFSGESMSGKSAPMMSSEVRTNSTIAACMKLFAQQPPSLRCHLPVLSLADSSVPHPPDRPFLPEQNQVRVLLILKAQAVLPEPGPAKYRDHMVVIFPLGVLADASFDERFRHYLQSADHPDLIKPDLPIRFEIGSKALRPAFHRPLGIARE